MPNHSRVRAELRARIETLGPDRELGALLDGDTDPRSEQRLMRMLHRMVEWGEIERLTPPGQGWKHWKVRVRAAELGPGSALASRVREHLSRALLPGTRALLDDVLTHLDRQEAVKGERNEG